MSAPVIRGATAADRPAILAITLASYQQYSRVIPAHWDGYRQNIRTTLGAAPPETQVVAELGGRVVGSVLIHPAGSAIENPGGTVTTLALPEVRLLAVEPAARGRGIAEALMRECIARARAAGDAAITLHTADMMASAMRLYERMGFRREPALDLEPVPGIIAKGYRFDLA